MELGLSMPTMVWPRAFLCKTLKILEIKVLQAKIPSFCLFLYHQGDTLLLCDFQVNIEQWTWQFLERRAFSENKGMLK